MLCHLENSVRELGTEFRLHNRRTKILMKKKKKKSWWRFIKVKSPNFLKVDQMSRIECLCMTCEILFFFIWMAWQWADQHVSYIAPAPENALCVKLNFPIFSYKWFNYVNWLDFTNKLWLSLNCFNCLFLTLHKTHHLIGLNFHFLNWEID